MGTWSASETREGTSGQVGTLARGISSGGEGDKGVGM